ncbi:hypothetical protein G6F70_005184 [Rhizopus microsporus]|uniref:Sorbose reductase sou1 n=1 Tax=Rhizopus azygosporus TaxID=86630 RepID=A0A367JSF6_RHIAZ|nr:hypothetical protein G6F71_007463 [Rhizopus microsporus]RCH92883.1 hypothetical protein CU097_007272 [Rhizopus azygosporus]KAG1199136.1 hypothetical protein G6F70_005184 [Rhizopus microsporus]KAG1210963.1 hypothetical protein G6F69_005003 [Rhizopus microsporus]KAG1232581.1 hypothetical protein G6F67_004900 [Rhizopus microsporus]
MSDYPTLPEFSLKGKKAIVTGGARGLGLEMSKALAQSGADVALMYVSNDKAHDLAAQIAKEYNVFCKAYKADVSNPDETRSAIENIVKEMGGVDIFVANAGVNAGGAAETYDLKTWHKLFDVNVHGVFYGVQAVSKYMLEKGKGSIIITSSISGTIVNRPQLQCAYNTTKSAVSMLTKCLAVEWAKRGVRVNAICPGYMKTDLLDNTNKENPDWEKTWLESTPMGRIGEASELKGAVVFLASDASSYVTGTELFVDGGYTAI